jgi:Family of unknown function (DUF6152)
MRIVRRVAPGVAAVTLMTVLNAASVWAHHSQSRFDATQTVAIDGVVTSVRWANPHVYLGVEQTTDTGETIEWDVETVGPSALRRLGWTRDSVVVGDRVSLRGNPARSGDRSLNLGSLQNGDRAIDVMALVREYTSVSVAPTTGATSLDGTWAVLANFTLIGPFLPRGPKPALTEAGAAAAASFDEQTMLPALQCVTSPAPFFMFILDAKRITTGEDAITILGDYEGGERTIHMNVADHAGATPSVHGHSFGRWEGDTLVIDTAHFTPLAMAHAYGVPSGVQKHLGERLTLNEDGTRIAYHFELSDPEFLAAPIIGDAEWAYRPDLELALEACDPVAARRFTE